MGRFFSADNRPTYTTRAGRPSSARWPLVGAKAAVSTPFGISSTRRAKPRARAASSGVVAMTAAARASATRSSAIFSQRFGPGRESRAYQKP